MPGDAVKKKKTGARAVKRSGRHRLEPDPRREGIGLQAMAAASLDGTRSGLLLLDRVAGHSFSSKP